MEELVIVLGAAVPTSFILGMGAMWAINWLSYVPPQPPPQPVAHRLTRDLDLLRENRMLAVRIPNLEKDIQRMTRERDYYRMEASRWMPRDYRDDTYYEPDITEQEAMSWVR